MPTHDHALLQRRVAALEDANETLQKNASASHAFFKSLTEYIIILSERLHTLELRALAGSATAAAAVCNDDDDDAVSAP